MLTQVDLMRMDRVRRLLREDRLSRQHAIASFVCSFAMLGMDLKQSVEQLMRGPIDPFMRKTVSEYCDVLEAKLLEGFRGCFGVDLELTIQTRTAHFEVLVDQLLDTNDHDEMLSLLIRLRHERNRNARKPKV